MNEHKKSFYEMFESSNKHIKLTSGSTIKGIIVSVTKDRVVVDTGLKSDSIVPISQFKNNDGEIRLNVGDKLNFILENIEDGLGSTILSREKAKYEESWLVLIDAYNSNKIVSGKVINKVKGGLILDINGIKGFLPGSLVDCRVNKEFLKDIEGQIIYFKIINLDYDRKTVIVSRKAVIQLEINKRKAKLGKRIGTIVIGIVKSIIDYGAFIEIIEYQVDGLLHITDISYKRIRHPKDVLYVGQKLRLKIIKYDAKTYRISLGLKQLEKDPWETLYKRFPPGTIIIGRVTNITSYGCFVTVDNNEYQGLVHIKEMSWKHKGVYPYSVVKVGQKVKVMILFIDYKKHKISLSMKACMKHPFQDFCKKYQIGSVINGKIKGITNFGLFVEIIKNQIDGLIHISDISNVKLTLRDLQNKYKKGHIIKSIILNIDLIQNRISLGLHPRHQNSFGTLFKKCKTGKIFPVKLISYDPIKFKVTFNLMNILYINMNLNKQYKNNICIGNSYFIKINKNNLKYKNIKLNIIKPKKLIHNTITYLNKSNEETLYNNNAQEVLYNYKYRILLKKQK